MDLSRRDRDDGSARISTVGAGHSGNSMYGPRMDTHAQKRTWAHVHASRRTGVSARARVCVRVCIAMQEAKWEGAQSTCTLVWIDATMCTPCTNPPPHTHPPTDPHASPRPMLIWVGRVSGAGGGGGWVTGWAGGRRVGQWCWWRGVVVMAAGRGCGWLCCTCGMAMGVDDDSVLAVAVVWRRRSCGVVHIQLYVLSTNN